MWVQLLSVQNVEIAGRIIAFHAGDWIEVGKQQGMLWITEGSARPADPTVASVFEDGTGLYIRGSIERVAALLGPFAKKPDRISNTPPVLHFDKTCVLSPTGFKTRLDIFGAGWKLLDRWEAVIPLLSYDRLARDMGTDAERSRTEQLVHELRIPVYDPRLMFIRKCEAGERLIDTFLEECALGSDEPLALLRAIAIVKPLLLAVPRTWVDRNAHRLENWR